MNKSQKIYILLEDYMIIFLYKNHIKCVVLQILFIKIGVCYEKR